MYLLRQICFIPNKSHYNTDLRTTIDREIATSTTAPRTLSLVKTIWFMNLVSEAYDTSMEWCSAVTKLVGKLINYSQDYKCYRKICHVCRHKEQPQELIRQVAVISSSISVTLSIYATRGVLHLINNPFSASSRESALEVELVAFGRALLCVYDSAIQPTNPLEMLPPARTPMKGIIRRIYVCPTSNSIGCQA
jgi:hypothetical protein